MKEIFNRRSIREFKNMTVGKEKNRQIVTCSYAGTIRSQSTAMGIYCR